ncbi:MAG TPA: PAS domain-containing protein, partial [Chroococcidiopsis sp.]
MRQSNNPRLQSIQETLRRYWIPLLLGVVGTIAVLGLWQQLQIQEQQHLQQLVQQEAATVESELSRELTNQVLTLQRMAKRWEVDNGTAEPFWAADAKAHIQDYSGLQAIEWVDSTFRVRWVVPNQGNERAQNLDLSHEPRRYVTLRVSRDLDQTLVTHSLLLAQGGSGFLICVPLWVNPLISPSTNPLSNPLSNPLTGPSTNLLTAKRFDGFILGVVRFQTFFDRLLKPSTRYEIQVYDQTGLIYRQHEALPTTALAQSMKVPIYGLDWQVQVVPTAELLRDGRSPLPSVVLWGGLLSVWTLALTIILGQRSERYARQAKQSNLRLQTEIIHRQQIESSLRESEERWQLALSGNNDGIWDWDVQTNTVFFSRRLKEMLGYADHEMSNSLDEWTTRVHPDDLGWVMDAVQEHFDQRLPFYSTEHRVRCKDGSYKWILDRGQALWDEAGHVIRMVGSHSDITERKQTELALRESERKYRHLIDHMNAGFIVHAPDTQVLQCNATA